MTSGPAGDAGTADPGTADPGTADPGTAHPGTGAAASYEQARDELARVVGRLEAGGLSLDESLDLWERGEHLALVCTRFLDGARQRVDAALERTRENPET
jgi:exodeoxyribonuclease VII small subunit